MAPILLKLGRVEIHSYGLLLAVSFLVGIFWAMRRAPDRGISRQYVLDLSVLSIVLGILGARLLYVLTHLQKFSGRWFDAISPIQTTGEIGISGLTMLGGLILVLVGLAIYCRCKSIPFFRLTDTLAPILAFGIFLTRIGCFLNGCCFGKPSDLPWAMVFPLISPAGSTMQGVRIHPTQLYSALYGLIILVVLLLLDRKRRSDGFLSAIFFVLYGLSRFLVDFFRYYESSVQYRFLGISLTVNQVISLLMIGGGILLIVLKRCPKAVKKP